MRDSELALTLLDWYDLNARDLPWRIPPMARKKGLRPDPYSVWLSEIMLQQTTVATVRGYFVKFLEAWPTIEALAQADDNAVMAAWAGLGYYARARNMLKCARLICEKYDGIFPDTYDMLIKLPGIGPYTAAAIAAIAFDHVETVVDGNVERVMARLRDVQTPLPMAKAALVEAASCLTPNERPGDYAQAVMDLGATICTPRAPACGICPWREACAGLRSGRARELPRKTPKPPKPVHVGTVYIARAPNGYWLLERRPPNGLLGGMLGWPGSSWDENQTPHSPPIVAQWHAVTDKVRHSFTHFHLVLQVYVAVVDAGSTAQITGFQKLDPTELPSLMRKAYNLADVELKNLIREEQKGIGNTSALSSIANE